ncbi:MAG TPA: ABATE domain-containing protein [Rhizomicrobium sp.]|nr:ABATE domain-containing protein [Rhizomicrobium sp.]
MIDREDFVAGSLCLDFVNTIGGIRSGVHNDRLESYPDLVDWAVLGGAVSCQQGDALRLIGRRRPEISARTLAEAKALRESLHAVFSAALKHQAPNRQAFDFVNQRLGIAMSHARIRRGAEKYEWTWEPPELLDAPLWPVVHNAGELLASETLARLRECASETCGWFFLDLTKNRSRRWCAMSGCGNRAKVRRFRDRQA